MTYLPTAVFHIDQKSAGGRPALSAWQGLQTALGSGLATAILKTPERRSGHAQISDFTSHFSAPCLDPKGAASFFTELVQEWHFAIEEIMNQRWNLVDNPYAMAWIMPGMILLHEDPIGFAIDLHAANLETASTLEEPATWAILMPKPESAHAALSALNALQTLPHASLLSAALDKAAREEGHANLCPLAWKQTIPGNAVFETIEA